MATTIRTLEDALRRKKFKGRIFHTIEFLVLVALGIALYFMLKR